MIHNGAALVHSAVPLWKHFYAESVEFALKHLNNNDHVYFTLCFKSFPSCPANPNHDLDLCSQCVKYQEYVNNILLSKYPETYHPILISDLDLDFTNLSFEIGLNALHNINNVTELQRVTYKDFQIGALISSQIADITYDAFFDISENFKLISDLYIHSCKFYDQIICLIRESSVNNVYVWNGRRPATGTVVKAANYCNINCLTHIIGSKLGDIFVSRGPYVHCLRTHHEYIEQAKNLLSEINCESEKHLEAAKQFFYSQRDPKIKTGFGQWNFANQFTQPFNPSSDKPILSIFTSTLWEKIGMSDYRPFFYDNEYICLEHLLSINELYDIYYVVVRLHPFSFNVGKNERLQIQRIINKFDDRANFIEPISPISSYSLLDASHVVVTFGSTMGIESVFERKPSILLAPALYQCLDCNIVPSSFAHLERLLVDMAYNTNSLHANSLKSLAYGLYEAERPHIEFIELTLKDNIFYIDEIQLNPSPSYISRIIRKVKHFLSMFSSSNACSR